MTATVALPRTAPSAQGVDAAAVSAFLDGVEEAGLELHSFMLFRGGAVVAEGFWAPYAADRPHMQHSAVKSWTATGVGLAIGDGLLSLDDRVVSFFAEHLPAEVSDNLATMTVQDLLTMRTGHLTGISGGEWRGMTESWIAAFLREPVPEVPGEHFIYSSASSYMLSAIVSAVTGKTLHEFLRARVFEPLGMGPTLWDLSPEGFNTGGNGLRCVTEDVVKFGALHLNDGMWDGRRILPEGWVADATRNHVKEVWMGALDGRRFLPRGASGGAPGGKRDGYGYQWWMTKHGYMASGLYGQQCHVLPRQGAVIAFTGGIRPRDPRLQELIWQHLLPALDGPGRPDADAALAGRLRDLRMPLPTGTAGSDMAARISGRRFAVAGNEAGVSAVRLEFGGDACVFTMEDGRGTHRIEAGLGRDIEGETTMTGNVLHHEYQPPLMRVLAQGVWLDPTRFCMTWRFVETAFCDTVTCSFGEDGVTLSRRVNTNAGPLEMPELHGTPEAAA